MGCISLPGASGVQWLKGDVYGHQRDSGGLITHAWSNAHVKVSHPPYYHQYKITLACYQLHNTVK